MVPCSLVVSEVASVVSSGPGLVCPVVVVEVEDAETERVAEGDVELVTNGDTVDVLVANVSGGLCVPVALLTGRGVSWADSGAQAATSAPKTMIDER